MSQFSHKDYIWLANAWHRLLGAQPCATDRMILIEAIEQFADLLAEQSPGFNKRLFIDNCLRCACGLHPRSYCEHGCAANW